MNALPPSIVGLVGGSLALAIAFAAWTQADPHPPGPVTPARAALPVQALADLPAGDDDAPPPSATPGTSGAMAAAASGATPSAAPLAVDVLGRLVLDAATVGVLDAWVPPLRADAAEAAARIDAFGQALRTRLPAPAVAQAMDLLRRYHAYRQDEHALRQRGRPEAGDARERLEQLAALRRRHFDLGTAQALFGVAESRARYALDVAAVLADPGLGEARQAQQILALRAQLPPQLQAEEGIAGFSLGLERQVAQMRLDGVAESEIAYRRKQYVEVEGEPSVLEREQEQQAQRRQAWELRHAGFVRQRDAVLADETLDEAEKQQRIEQLLRSQLPAAERAAARQMAAR